VDNVYSTVELPPKFIVGELVELIEAPARPEKPFKFAVSNCPLSTTTPDPPPQEIEVAPAAKVAPEAMVRVLDADKESARLAVLKTPAGILILPVVASPRPSVTTSFPDEPELLIVKSFTVEGNPNVD
jgi:hypothetical protein